MESMYVVIVSEIPCPTKHFTSLVVPKSCYIITILPFPV